MGSELDQASSAQPHGEEDRELPSKTQGLKVGPRTKSMQVIQNVRQLKSFEIARSAVTAFASNLRFMFLMILSIIPLFAFMIFYEIKLQKAIKSLPIFLDNSDNIHMLVALPDDMLLRNDTTARKLKFYRTHVADDDFLRSLIYKVVELSLLYFVLYPFVEIFSVVVSIKLAARAKSGETQVPLKQILKQTNLEGTLVTHFCVHLLSTVTLAGFFWIFVNHRLFTGRMYSDMFFFGRNGYWYQYDFHSIEFYMHLLSIAFHSAIFIVLLCKYLGWSASWNMAMVISVLEEESTIEAFGLSDYYGKHSKQTGFQLMLAFFTFCNLLRLPSLYFGLCSTSYAGICVSLAVMGVFCLGNLVKWVAMVLYFYDCKQQVMEKKGDEEVCKSSPTTADVC